MLEKHFPEEPDGTRMATVAFELRTCASGEIVQKAVVAAVSTFKVYSAHLHQQSHTLVCRDGPWQLAVVFQ